MSDKQSTPRSDDLLLQQLFWLNKLSGTLPDTTLLADLAKLQKHARAINRFAFDLPRDVSEKVFKLSKNSRLSVYIVLVSAFTLLVNRYTGDDDLIIGSPAYDPEARGDRNGNLVPMRFTIDADDTFKTHLMKVKQTALDAYNNAAYPFERLVEALGVAREDGRFPIFDIIVSLRDIHDESHLLRMKNNLSVSFVADEQSIAGEVVYNSLVFNEGTISSLAGHFINTVGSVLRNPDIKLSEVEMLSREEERRLLVEFNNCAAEIPAAKTVPELFEDQVRKSPDRIAAVFGSQSVSYAELNARANRMAHHIRAMGAGRETVVALLARRGIDFWATVLAIFKAGAAYLPLDIAAPPKRTLQVLAQSKASFILVADEFRQTIEQALEAIPENARPQVAPVDDLLRREGREDNPRSKWEANSLSYVIYTSGSTGMPKGAMIEHAGMRNHLYAKVLDLQIKESDRVAQNAPQCFDISIWQFLSVLLVGGSVHIASDDTARDVTELLAMLEREKITILEIVPSQMRAMLEVIESATIARPALSSLRWLIVNGEVLPPELCRQWLALYPAAALINAYGHTECSDDETHYALREPPAMEVAAVPIGRPLANLRLYLLDGKLSPVPTGVPGEVYVGGIAVGRGYLNDPERTASVYVPDPFSSEPGARLYKTGDLARHLPSGDLEFVSRIDFQVKVRGFRIELGEIESALGQHAAVRESVVIVRQDEPNQARVVAYVVAKQEPVPTTSELHSFLKERLPEYMVPSSFVMLDRVPLNQNGKVDRHALPVPDRLRPGLSKDFVAPRTPVEEMMADIWTELLGIERVGIHDNFFELGGHSLLATQVMSRVREAFQIELPLRMLFELPTVEGLALAVTQAQVDEMDSEEMAQMIEELNTL